MAPPPAGPAAPGAGGRAQTTSGRTRAGGAADILHRVTTACLYCADLAGERVQLDDAEAHHALRSLRLRAGDQLELIDGRGGWARGALETAAGRSKGRPNGASVRIIDRRQLAPSRRRLELVTAGCKGERQRWLVEKCTELGVDRLVLAEFARSVVHGHDAQTERLQRYAIEACKQCRRPWAPQITSGLSLLDAVTPASAVPGHHNGNGASAERGTGLLVCDLAPDAVALSAALPPGADARVTIVIGPEGGLTDAEREALRARGGRTVRLGRHVLRVETAAVAAAAIWSAIGVGDG